MKAFLPTVFLLIVSFITTNSVSASCLAPQTVKKEAERSALIFIGKVIKITPAKLADVQRVSSKNLLWEKSFYKTDLVTFSVIEAFKGVSDETLEIATSAEGAANYTFEGGTWLKKDQTYLVYANKIIPAGTVDESEPDSGYSRATIAEFRKIQKSIPKELAAEVNEFNSKVSAFSAGVCGRTKDVEQAWEEIRQIREIFPESKKFNDAKTAPATNSNISAWQRILTFFGLA